MENVSRDFLVLLFPVNTHTTDLEYEARVVVSAKGRTGRKVGADAVVRSVLSVSRCGSDTDWVDYWQRGGSRDY